MAKPSARAASLVDIAQVCDVSRSPSPHPAVRRASCAVRLARLGLSLCPHRQKQPTVNPPISPLQSTVTLKNQRNSAERGANDPASARCKQPVDAFSLPPAAGRGLPRRNRHGLSLAAIYHRLVTSSVIARNWTELRRGAVGEVEKDLIDIAPSPPFWRIVAFDDRVSGCMKMLSGVAIRRVVATADVTACPTQSQMYPLRTGCQALLAAASTWRHIADYFFVAAFIGHMILRRLFAFISRALVVLSERFGR
jgi:hypothetical protein